MGTHDPTQHCSTHDPALSLSLSLSLSRARAHARAGHSMAVSLLAPAHRSAPPHAATPHTNGRPRLVPPLCAAMEEIDIGAIRFRAFDLGGHAIARKVWREYSQAVDACVFIIDAVDRERFAEAKQELNGLLGIPELDNVPVMVLLNKIDIATAASEAEMRAVLDLPWTQGGASPSSPSGDERPIWMFPCSILKKMGYKEGFQWLSQHIQ